MSYEETICSRKATRPVKPPTTRGCPAYPAVTPIIVPPTEQSIQQNTTELWPLTPDEYALSQLQARPIPNSLNCIQPQVNGRTLSNIELMKPSTTINEIEMRKDNTHQKFITKENITIYLDKMTINRINFKQIQKMPRKEKTINLPGRYLAKLKVRADGSILFKNYRKRGLGKNLKMILSSTTTQRGGECSSSLSPENK